jgi:hypothetical protein
MVFSERRYVLVPPYTRCDPKFGMDGTELLNIATITPIPNIGSRGAEVDSYRLKENDIIFPIHTLDMS